MKKLLWLALTICLSSNYCFSQGGFSDETKKYIDYNDPVTIFKNALLIDGRGGPAKPHQTVIVRNGKIDWIGDDASAVVPPEGKVIDLDGKALMPGLVMLHEHMYMSAFSTDPFYLQVRQLPLSFPRLYLAAGATTIRTAGSVEPYSDLRIKQDIDRGLQPGPSIDLTAPYIEGKNGLFPQMKEDQTPEEAAAFVNYWADQGFTSFKAYMGIDKPTLKAAIDAAHRRKLKITGHLCAVTYSEAAELGIDSLEHGFGVSTDFVTDKKEGICPPDNGNRSLAALDIQSEPVKQLLQRLVSKKVVIDSTLAVFEGVPSDEALAAMSPDNRDFYLKLFAATKSGKAADAVDKAFINDAKMEKMFYELGGLLTVGTDPTGRGGTLAG
jgi:imidazolonepropionase-like amidohydrolase